METFFVVKVSGRIFTGYYAVFIGEWRFYPVR
jgi:hypothetical protein